MITSEFLIVESLWAITNTVLPFMSWSIPSCTIFSVRVSMLEVASSKTNTGGFATATLAIARSCLCPWERLLPLLFKTV